jgi:hypothetical protein
MRLDWRLLIDVCRVLCFNGNMSAAVYTMDATPLEKREPIARAIHAAATNTMFAWPSSRRVALQSR